MKRLSPMDASFLMMETPQTPQHVGGALIYRLPKGAGPTFVRDLFEQMRSHLVNRAPFTYRLAKSKVSSVAPSWEEINDSEVDIDKHFFRVALPSPGTERDLNELLSRMHAEPLDRSRPLWACWLIEGLEGNRIAIYSKVHHAMMDGTSGNRIMVNGLSEDPEARNIPPFWSTTLARKPKLRTRTSEESVSAVDRLKLLGGKIKTVGSLFQGLSESKRAAADPSSGLTAAWAAPQSIFNSEITALRQIETNEIEFKRIHALSKALDGTINDVVVSIIGGALRRYLQATDDLPSASLTCSMPVSLNKAGSDDGGNQFAAIFAAMGTDIDDPLERFNAVRSSIRNAKKFLAKLDKDAVGPYTALIMMPFMIEQVTGRKPMRSPLFNVTISNMPGPRATQYWNGMQLEKLAAATVLQRGQGLNITVISFADKFLFNYLACPDVSPNIELLAGYVLDEFETLVSAVTERSTSAQSAVAHAAKRPLPVVAPQKLAPPKLAPPPRKAVAEKSAPAPVARKAPAKRPAAKTAKKATA